MQCATSLHWSLLTHLKTSSAQISVVVKKYSDNGNSSNLQPSMDVFKGMLHDLEIGRDNSDGADQGFLVGCYPDLLDKPMFHPPENGTKLNGTYRLPLGYQMDASYYCECHCYSAPISHLNGSCFQRFNHPFDEILQISSCIGMFHAGQTAWSHSPVPLGLNLGTGGPGQSCRWAFPGTSNAGMILGE